MLDFFVSYNRQDRVWAEWIAWTLEEAGYTPMPGRSLYATHAESARATKPVEFAYADLERDCRQPSAFRRPIPAGALL